MSKILDNLYLGSYADAKNSVYLKKINITHIVTVGVELQAIYPDSFQYLYIPAYDSPTYKLIDHFDKIADFIHKAIDQEKGNVFVHCYWGISRSTTSVIAYLVKYLRMNPLKARRYIKSKRSIIFPNEGFVKQLEEYAKKLGVIEEKITNSASSTLTGFTHTKEGDKFVVQKSTTSSAKMLEQDYYCKNCGFKVFNTQDIEHNFYKNPLSNCSAIYSKHLKWMGTLKGVTGKTFCPNAKCHAILGFWSQNGGNCSCGKRIDSLFAFYSLRVVAAKATKTKMV